MQKSVPMREGREITLESQTTQASRWAASPVSLLTARSHPAVMVAGEIESGLLKRAIDVTSFGFPSQLKTKE